MSKTEPSEEPEDLQESMNSREHPEAGTRFKSLLDKGAFYIGVLALLAALVALGRRSFILWVVLTIGFSIASAPLIPAVRTWKYTIFAYALLCAITGAALCDIIAFPDIIPLDANSETVASIAHPIIKISSPTQGSSQGRCFNVTGEAKISAGDAIFIYSKGINPPYFYVQGQARLSPSPAHPGWEDWSYDGVKVGSVSSSGIYGIYALVLTSGTYKYLKGPKHPVPGKNGATTYKNDPGVQVDQSLPPSVALDSKSVQRMPNSAGSCG